MLGVPLSAAFLSTFRARLVPRVRAIGAQIVQIPETFALARAEVTFRVFMGSLLGVLIAVAVTLNLLLWWMFIRPVTKISALADRVSLGEVDAPDFVARSADEVEPAGGGLRFRRRAEDGTDAEVVRITLELSGSARREADEPVGTHGAPRLVK